MTNYDRRDPKNREFVSGKIKKTSHLNIWLTEDDLARFRSHAQVRGISLSEFCRVSMLEAMLGDGSPESN